MFTGPISETEALSVDLRERFPNAVKETAQETKRHLDMLKAEVGGFKHSTFPDDVAVAFRFETAPASSPTCPPSAIRELGNLARDYKDKLTIGHVAIDTQRVPYACAVAVCTDSTAGLVGSLGGNRYNYFRIMKHFYGDDEGGFVRNAIEATTEAGIGYRHVQQWDQVLSPLRMDFRSGDPKRDNWGLAVGSSSENKPTILVKNGYAPEARACVSVRLRWLETLTLIIRGEDHGIPLRFDTDGQLMISGFALKAAGLIDEQLDLTYELTARELQQHEISTASPEDTAMATVLNLYGGFLINALEDLTERDAPPDLRSHLQDHLDSASNWILERNRRPDVLTAQPVSQYVN